MNFDKPPPGRGGGGPPPNCPHSVCSGRLACSLVKRRRIDDVDSSSDEGDDLSVAEMEPSPVRFPQGMLGAIEQPYPVVQMEEVDIPRVAQVLDWRGIRGSPEHDNGPSSPNSGPEEYIPIGQPIPIAIPLPAPLQSPVTPPGPSSGGSISNIRQRVDELGWQESRPALVQRAGYLLNNSRMSDVRFLVGETKSEIHAHKTILALGSPVFEAQFYGSIGSGANDVIELPDMEHDTFLLFLKYLYTDELENSLDDTQLLCLLRPAKKYIVPHLVDRCSDILMTELKPENIFQILHHAQFFQLKKLEGACNRYIDRNSQAIVNSEEFINLGKPILTDFLKRDGLNMNEEALFQAVLRWASSECQRNSIEANYENLRLTLGDCLKLIRFPAMKRDEFASVYDKILSPEEACSVFVYMCKSSTESIPPTLEFPTQKREFSPRLCVVSRFSGDPVEHSLNYRSGEIYNYRINFKVDREIFMKGANIFSIRCGVGPLAYASRREFSGALYLSEKEKERHNQQPPYLARKQFNKVGSLELDESPMTSGTGRRQYYPVMFDSEIRLQAGKHYSVCVVASVSSQSYPATPLQTYVGINEQTKSAVMHSEDLVINFTFLGSSVDGSVGRFTSAQIPELIFCL
ncbi:BTB/POZ domain-containing protein 6 [Orchesella cincta]|uniref:BTB/POZ domain-containing protein 6 n=1 Tax=Orchesella cincta TaxID=48709 RepID=A0A1D2NHS5_ORCCI|nr:BTB/POZ domain-containing protein 6 [Orchesella cincta]